jgi:hypothetical protein
MAMSVMGRLLGLQGADGVGVGDAGAVPLETLGMTKERRFTLTKMQLFQMIQRYRIDRAERLVPSGKRY